MPAVVVTGRHRPHEVLLLVFSAALGAVFLFGAKPPGSIEQLMPAWLRWTWYLLLFVSGVVGVVSFLLRNPYNSLPLERGAMWGQGAAFGMYALGIFALGGQRGIAAGGLCVAWAAASVWRALQIGRDLRLMIRRAGEEGR